MNKELTLEEKTHLTFLKRQEHQCQIDSQRTSFNHPNINQNWDRARKELKEYVATLRTKGKNI